MRTLALAVTGGFAAYLILLGLVALTDPDRAFRFLGKFAQTRRANAVEALCRIAVGMAFVQLAPDVSATQIVLGFGWILVISAIAMLALPDLHRRFADRTVPAVRPFLRFVGVISLGGGLLLAALLWPLIAFRMPPY